MSEQTTCHKCGQYDFECECKRDTIYPKRVFIKPDTIYDNFSEPKPEGSFSKLMYVVVNPWFQEHEYPETEYVHLSEIAELKDSNRTLNELCAELEARILSDSELIEKLRKALSEEMSVVDFYAHPDTKEVRGRIIEYDVDAGPLYEKYSVPCKDDGTKARTRIAERREL